MAKKGDLIELTQEAFDELFAELERRKGEERESIAAEISAARELGDLRENHAYTFAMEKKELNENRIVELEDMLKKAHVVTTSTTGNVVTIGKTVVIKNVKTKTTREVQLVGSEETQAADPRSGKISVDSPIGKALFKAKLGEKVQVVLPTGTVEYEIVEFAKATKAA